MQMARKAGVLMLGLIGLSITEAQAGQLIEDFGANADRRWGYVQDGVMGGVSQGALSFEDDSGTSFARLTGSVSTDNNGGFIQFRANIRNGLIGNGYDKGRQRADGKTPRKRPQT